MFVIAICTWLRYRQTMHRLALPLAFCAGACATTAVTSVASEPAPPAEAKPDVTPPDMGAPGQARVISLADAEHRQPPSKKADVWLLARGEHAFVGKLELAAGGAVPEHRDATEEYLHIVEGSGKLMIDGAAFEVGPGTTIYMPANAKVSYQNGDARLVALQVFAGPAPASKYDSWSLVRE